jgi:type IV pilus assembly protein PilV
MMRKISNLNNSKETGFTLLEVVIAMVILSVGILAIASLQVSSINGAATARFSTEAGIYAQEQLEKMIGMDFDPQNGIIPAELTVGNHTLAQHVGDGQDGDDLPPSHYTLSWRVIGPDVPVDDAVTIEMTVRWEERGIDRSITYTHVKGASI